MARLAAWIICLIVGAALGTALESSYVEAQVTAGPKLGYIDTERILDESEMIMQTRNELRKEEDRIQAELQTIRTELEEKMRQLDAQKEFLKPEVYNQQYADLRKKFIDYQALRQQKLSDLKEKYVQAARPIREQVNEVVQQIAQEEGFSFIFAKETLAYCAPKYDLTQKVIDRLNK